ncbi:hypothetical protein [Methylobacter sp.]|uniref:hypothetical protein n=1 Tax=Methylobacter sp. TaxID=2051955 RepID=UPI002488FD9D|nr:hypothetical protein [Methylobacter sp.]MDI1278076.1 hypothetical protein [Methylobacter sp.]
MKLINPTEVTDTMLVSSTVPENDYPEWDPFAAYIAGNRYNRISTHRAYECLVDNTNFTPETNLTGTAPKWLDIGPTNQRAMFDNKVGTSTTCLSPLTVVLRPGGVSGIGLLECVGAEAVVVLKDAPSGVIVYARSISLDGTSIDDVYDWFTLPYEQRTQVVLTDLPYQYANPELTITISGSGIVGCGVCKFGPVFKIGDTQYGATAGIIDYSVKTKDSFGNYSFAEGAYSKKASFKVDVAKKDFNRIDRYLASLRVKPCIYIGTESVEYEPLTIYGKYNDFTIDVPYPEINYCSIEIEGLI